MTIRRIPPDDLRSGCAEPGPGDGDDPRFDRRDFSARRPGRKALQLCGQVARTLSAVLAGCGDGVLRDLLVVSVTPAPNSSRLLVTLAPAPGSSADPARVSERLEGARGLLRREVAAAIHRRRVPDLTYQLRAADS